MSWDIYLDDEDGQPVQVRPFVGGGTIMVNPETMEEIPQVKAELNVTYNYSSVFQLAAAAALYELGRGGVYAPSPERTMLEAWYEDGIRSLDNARASDVTEGLRLMLRQLDPRGRGPNDAYDYWAPTPLNAAQPLRTLLEWCEQEPDATFTVH